MLVVPVLKDTSLNQQHLARDYYAKEGILSSDQMEYFRELYLGDAYGKELHSLKYLYAPLYTEEKFLRKFCPIHMFLATYDILYEEGMEFASLLQSLNNKANVSVYKAGHSFFNGFYDKSDKAIDDFVAHLDEMNF